MKPFTSAPNGRASWSLDNQHETLKVRIPTQKKIQTDNDHPVPGYLSRDNNGQVFPNSTQPHCIYFILYFIMFSMLFMYW